MFRRKRSSSNPPRPGSTTPSAAAALAASQAFLANRASNADLSASAAAAALRSHTTSPMPVGQIQTKRMQRRISVSSNVSAPARPVGLQRRDSGGSMTERTFREPSPSRGPERPASSHGPYAMPDEEILPPVPSLPYQFASPPPAKQNFGQRPNITETPPRLNSPPPQASQGRGVSLDRGAVSTPAPRTGKQRLSNVEAVGEAQQAASQAVNRASVNYSRPMSPQDYSTSPPAGGRERLPPPSGSITAVLPISEVERIMGSLQDTAERPIKKKKKKKLEGLAEGSHLAAGSTGSLSHKDDENIQHMGRTQPVSVENTGLEPLRQQKKKKKAVPKGEPKFQERDEGFGNAYPSDTDSVVSDVSSTTDRPRGFNTRAAGLLAKQPSIVREDLEGEERAERRLPSPVSAPQITANAVLGIGTLANTSRTVSRERQHIQSVSQSDSSQASDLPLLEVPGSARPESLSPARAAHFLAQPTCETPEGAKHQPPGRSVSPAKSALKYSPSQGHSPSIRHSTGLAPSEASDTASGLSDDGSRPGGKRKKSVRVSFDEDSVLIGQAASSVSTDSPVIMSPQNKPKTRSWLDLVRDSKTSLDESGQNLDDTSIKPTPTLPSFGSVRGRNQKTTPAESDTTSSINDLEGTKPKSLGNSFDQGIGALIAEDGMKRDGANRTLGSIQSFRNTLPSDAASVEASGHQSDDDRATREASGGSALSPQREGQDSQSSAKIIDDPVRGESSQPQPPSQEPTGSVPSIAVMPATPGVDELIPSKKEWLGMPGGFSGAPEALKQQGNQSNEAMAPEANRSGESPLSALPAPNQWFPIVSAAEHPSPVITPATLGIAEPEPEGVAALHDSTSPHVGEVAEILRTQIDSHSGESTDDDSIYSDAAEDQSDVEGDGFGSINAIVESPAEPNFATAYRSPPASPTPGAGDAVKRQPPAKERDEVPEPAATEGWDRAQAYWSGLSQTRKQQLEHAALPGAVDEPVIPDRTMRGKESVAKKKKKKTKKTITADRQEDLPERISTRNPNNAPALRVMQPNAGAGTHTRDSMQDGKPLKPGLKESTYRKAAQAAPSEPHGILQKRTRPVSAVAMINYNKSQLSSGVSHARSASATNPSSPPTPDAVQKKKISTPKPKLARAISNGSESDSSFKRLRSSTPDTSKYKMKRTMRGGSAGPGGPISANRASSLSARTASPANSTTRRPFSSVGPTGGGMRTSMRDSIDSSKPARMSLRGSMDSSNAGRTKSPSRFGFGLGTKSKEPKAPKAASRRSSRFADSSDDDDGLPTMASSRFADSSDEDEAGSLAPVRGIPRRIDEGDSTDLEDSSSEKGKVLASGRSNDTQPTTVSAPSTKPEGQALASGSLRTPSGGSPPTATMGTGLQAKKAAEKEKKKRSFLGVLGSRKKDDPSRVPNVNAESAARRDLPVERTAAGSKLSPLVTTPKKGNAATFPASPSVTTSIQGDSTQASPKSPKLQRRNTPKGFPTVGNPTAWPLGQSPAGSKANTVGTPASRPRTSDGASPSKTGAARPELGGRGITVQSTVSAPGKKKRFPMLRKAFGLHD